LLDRSAGAQREGEAGGKAVAGTVRVDERAGKRRRVPAALAIAGDEATSVPALGRGDEPRGRVELADPISLAVVAAAVDEGVELDARIDERGQHAGGGNDRARPPCLAERRRVSGSEVDRVDLVQLLPRERVGRMRIEPWADRRDRPLAAVVEVREAAPLRLVPEDRLDAHSELLELVRRSVAEVVVPERREEDDVAGQPEELTRCDGAPSGGLDPRLARVHDLAGLWHSLDTGELDPFHMADYRGPHLTSVAATTLKSMMEVVSVPPFERFYEEHRNAVFGHLVRLLGRQRAEDAFQETFLRALRGYPSLTHGRYLRAWVFTIATRVAADDARRRRPEASIGAEPAHEESRPAYAELEHLADELPGKERAAVVLRYGYDLPYDQIADALGSSEDAARQAASSGVRRLRRRLT
jgi:RNA polymerase sigma factor (sigma-70 family)